MKIAPNDWDRLEKLVVRVGLKSERVGQLKRRMEGPSSLPGRPLTLIVGRRDAGIELLLGRWLGNDAAQELDKAGRSPLVVGPAPQGIKPRLGVWPSWRSNTVSDGHLIVVRVADKLEADAFAQLASLGYIDLAVLVTRLSQPMNQVERELARSVATLAATAQVIVVALPGEEVSDSDVAEVESFTASHLRRAGFSEGRCLGVAVRTVDGEPGASPSRAIGPLLRVSEAKVSASREGMFEEALRRLFDEIRQLAVDATKAPWTPINSTERDRLVREFAGFLADLGRELELIVAKRQPATADILRSHALDAVSGWGAYIGIAGHWMKFVEGIRPGARAALLAEVGKALMLLEYRPPEPKDSASPSPPAAPSPLPDRYVAEAKRLGIGLACGVLAYGLTASLLGGLTSTVGPPPVVGLPPVVTTLLSYAALLLGGGLGYLAARHYVPTWADGVTTSPRHAAAAELHGWLQVERRLTAWFAGWIDTPPASVAEECRLLVERFKIE